MANGKTHDRVNMLIGTVIVGTMIGFTNPWQIVFSFSTGWLVATYVFTPDLDVGPKNRKSLFGVVLYPYSIFFKHRGLSHSLFFGTLSRVTYVALVTLVFYFIFLSGGLEQTGGTVVSLIKGYNYNIIFYKAFTWVFIGMLGADLCHILVDKVTHVVNKIF